MYFIAFFIKGSRTHLQNFVCVCGGGGGGGLEKK